MDQFNGVDTACYNDLSAMRRALVSEVAADDTYAEILRLTLNESVREVITEIQADEQNHQGRLIALIAKLSGGDDSPFAQQMTAGLENRELKT